MAVVTPNRRAPTTRTHGPSKASRKRERKLERLERHFLSSARIEFVQRLPCVSCRLEIGASHNHHDPTKAAGGTYLDLSPLCVACHHERHQLGVVTFWKSVGMSYQESNAATERAWLDFSQHGNSVNDNDLGDML